MQAHTHTHSHTHTHTHTHTHSLPLFEQHAPKDGFHEAGLWAVDSVFALKARKGHARALAATQHKNKANGHVISNKKQIEKKKIERGGGVTMMNQHSRADATKGGGGGLAAAQHNTYS